MSWTRRDLLKAAAATATLPLLPLVPACGVDPGPEYAYDGPAADRERFTHGVASGDPLTDSVILWTRVDLGDNDSLEVYVEVHDSPELDRRVGAAYVTATAERNGCVKVDLEGLKHGREYHYRFRCQDQTSPVGRTRTAPRRPDALTLGVASCSNYSRGWFHLYRFLAEQDLDAIVHLGDYIYEYGAGGGQPRPHDPPHEILTLDDYRRRYAQYRSDADLAEAHRLHPWILTWDDHETANDGWEGGAQNHDEGEGDWADRLSASRQAWFEWQPVREGTPGRIYRRMAWGDFADIVVLDTRIEGREKQTRNTDETTRTDRQLLGTEQESWLIDALSTSTAHWSIVAQQVVMAHWGKEDATPINGDAWDGYPETRRRVLEAARDLPGLVVLTGDVHSSFANDLPVSYDAYEAEGGVGVEAVTPGITSPGLESSGVVDLLMDNTPHILWGDTVHRGCVVIRFTEDDVTASWYHLTGEQIETEAYQEPTLAAKLRSVHGQPGWKQEA